MPLLGGLFHRRRPRESASVASTASNRDSTEDVLPDPSLYNISAAASSKLRLAFRRRQPPPQPVSLNHVSSVTSDSGHALPPPPRKSALFAAHNSSLHSVHSLPNHPYHSDAPHRTDTPAESTHKTSPGLFSWARERTKSKPPLPSSSTSPPPDDPPSFNLMSFRHVRPDSSENSPLPDSDSLLPPARPRPRGDSVASDSSQRISVAAFKEAQARSRANSPVPSFRPPSTADTLRADPNGRKRASTVSVLSAADRPQPNKTLSPPLTPSTRPASSAVDTSSEESEEDEDDDQVDSDGEPIPNPTPKPTIKRPTGGIHSRSDTGHSIHRFRHEHPKPSSPAPRLTPRSHQLPYLRQRASVSTSALTPSGAAVRASTLAAANSSASSHAHSTPSSRKPNDDTDESTSSSDTDSEDLPLSDLVPPRRPGSAVSNHSNGRPRAPAKPLIDINSLATRPPLLAPILRHENSVKNLNTRRKEQEAEKDQPFSIPAVLALSSSASSSISPSITKQNTTPANVQASVPHHRRSSGDVPALDGPDDDDLINAIRLVGALDKEEYPSTAPKPSDTPTSNRIVPTPIRAREPPTSFTVLSRPPQRQSTADTSSSLSPVSQTRFTTSPSSLSSQSEAGTRQRASTMINPTTQGDKSDTMSISARSSVSRTSSRIPPVPLIHSIPDSPSVKEGWKPGRPPTTPRTNPSSSTSNKPPQRPFASSSSVRGESPAGSSTGDSSSGRAPFTPRDGSDIGVRSKDDAGDVGSTLKARGHAKKPSVTFEDQPVRGRERAKTGLTDEERTRERRRSEAKAALELGKIVNGRRPLVHVEDEDMTLRGRNPTINVTMENGMMQPGWAPWQQPMGTGMSNMASPQFGADPAYLAAHQRALLIAKQAYQMAVAQQAMQMAGDEWERTSNMGFGSGGSVYGGASGGSVYGGGSGGSVYGGGSGGSVYGGPSMGPMNMMGMPNMGMLMPPNQWGRSSVAFPSSSSVFGISSSQSEFGGGGGWGTRSVYGDSFGPSSSRTSFVGKGNPGSSASAASGRPRASTGASPSASSSQPAKAPGKSAVRTRAAPPSSWKSGR